MHRKKPWKGGYRGRRSVAAAAAAREFMTGGESPGERQKGERNPLSDTSRVLQSGITLLQGRGGGGVHRASSLAFLSLPFPPPDPAASGSTILFSSLHLSFPSLDADSLAIVFTRSQSNL